MFSIILAIDETNGLGKNNCIPWKCTNDMLFFAKQTKGSILIVGKNTWDSMPQSRILKDRNVIVVSRTLQNGNTLVAHSLNEALSIAYTYNHNFQKVFVIGGLQLYKEAVYHKDCNKIYLTFIKGKYNCDKIVDFLPFVFRKFAANYNIYFEDCTIFHYIKQPFS